MRPQADTEGRKHPPVPGQSGRVSPKWSLVCLRAFLLPGQQGPEGSFVLLVNAWISIQVRDYSSLFRHPDFVFTQQGQPKPCGPCLAKFRPCLTEAMAEAGDGKGPGGSPGCLATTTKVRTWHHVGARRDGQEDGQVGRSVPGGVSSVRACQAGLWSALSLTTEIYQVCVEEGLSMKLFYVQYGGPLKATSQGFLGTTFVCNEGL